MLTAETRPLKTWLVKGLIPAEGHGLLSGQWGTGKTFVAFDLATAVGTGQPFLGHAIKRPCRASCSSRLRVPMGPGAPPGRRRQGKIRRFPSGRRCGGTNGPASLAQGERSSVPGIRTLLRGLLARDPIKRWAATCSPRYWAQFCICTSASMSGPHLSATVTGTPRLF